MTNVIDALKRLERAGAEDSRATQRLVEAAGVLGRHIAAHLPPETAPQVNEYDHLLYPLPRSFAVRGESLVRFWDRDPDYDRPVDADRETALFFAREVATGWLDELAEWLEARTAEADESAATLDAARDEAEYAELSRQAGDDAEATCRALLGKS